MIYIKNSNNLVKKSKYSRNITFVFKTLPATPNENCLDNPNVVFDDILNLTHSGFDLKACECDIGVLEDGYIKISNTELITNKVILIKSHCKWSGILGTVLHLYPRSGISYKTPLRLANAVGTIEAGYRGDIGILLDVSGVNKPFNYKDLIIYDNNFLYIKQYTPLVQAIIEPTIYFYTKQSKVKKIEVLFTVDNNLYDNWETLVPSTRSSDGFGSTDTTK